MRPRLNARKVTPREECGLQSDSNYFPKGNFPVEKIVPHTDCLILDEWAKDNLNTTIDMVILLVQGEWEKHL